MTAKDSQFIQLALDAGGSSAVRAAIASRGFLDRLRQTPRASPIYVTSQSGRQDVWPLRCITSLVSWPTDGRAVSWLALSVAIKRRRHSRGERPRRDCSIAYLNIADQLPAQKPDSNHDHHSCEPGSRPGCSPTHAESGFHVLAYLLVVGESTRRWG